MNSQKCILILFGFLFILVGGGCRKSASPFIDKALSATNIVFQANLSEPIELTQSQIDAFKKILLRFKDDRQVRIEGNSLPVESGGFNLGNLHFSWVGDYLYFHAEEQKSYFVIEAPVFAKMNDKFNKFQGTTLPLRYPSTDEWKVILEELTKAEIKSKN